MARRGSARQYGWTPAQRAEVWARWKAGESTLKIGRAVGKESGSVFTLLAIQGGIVRPPRHRAARALTPAEREQISRGAVAAQSTRATARELGRPASTISREVARNGGRTQYRAV